ncbi:hypothetical protein GCM10010912_62910 [Paenibacillus albidus]|uniref:Uncharacterized protein n=1 Tax=Paenibacillus albidus TaxID=2041023 RepID=A0A917D3R8_9BACL|nr:hypothetical protein [Paenibacillus albidus]GGG09902.1 hypothetical protein GCM10010912_62910 [Paenibacillus albidus]
MGVKHGRDYSEILNDLTEAVGRISDGYVFFEMEPEEWQGLPQESKLEVWEALAEDLFFALGNEPVIEVGSAVVIYNKDTHRINILLGEEDLASVVLV